MPDEVIENLVRRLSVGGGKYGTWLTCTEAAALLKMLNRPPQHKAVLSPESNKRLAKGRRVEID